MTPPYFDMWGETKFKPSFNEFLK